MAIKVPNLDDFMGGPQGSVPDGNALEGMLESPKARKPKSKKKKTDTGRPVRYNGSALQKAYMEQAQMLKERSKEVQYKTVEENQESRKISTKMRNPYEE
jgi:hypothetical protein